MRVELPEDGNLKQLCDRYGVHYEAALDRSDHEDLRPVSPDDIADDINGVDTTTLSDTSDALDTLQKKFDDHPHVSLSDTTGTQIQTFGDEGPFDEIGAPGVDVVGGVLRAEPTSKYRPYQVRGHVTRHGLYEKFYRQEPVLFEGINEGNNIFASGNIRFVDPDVPTSQSYAAEQFTAWCNNWLQQIWRGPQYYQRHVGAAKIFGFYPFEVVWGVDASARVRPVKLAPREPSTVDKWIFSSRGNELVGATFHAPNVSSGSPAGTHRKRRGSKGSMRYTLTASGPALPDHRLHIPAIYSRANNIEGISLIRPVIHWVKFKQVLHQIAAVTAQKYGVPTAVITQEPIDGDAFGNAADQGDSDYIFQKVAGQQASDAPVYQLSRGYDIKLLDPGGTMPTLVDLLNYADQMIAKTTKSESGLLGQGTVGSYALSETLDNSMMRAQPGFAAEVLQPLDWMVRDIAKWHGVELDRYPRAVWEMDGFSDGSRWLEDMTKAMGGRPMWEWPDEAQKEAAKKLNLSPTLFDDFDPPEPEPQRQPAAMIDDGHDCDDDCSHGMRWEFSEGVVHEDMQEDEARKFRDRLEAQVGKKLRSIAISHRDSFRDRVRDGTIDIETADALFREEYLPRYKEAVYDAFTDTSDKGKRKMLRRMGYTVPRGAEMPSTEKMKNSIESTAFAVAREIYSRQQGSLVDALASMTTTTRMIDQDDLFDESISDEERKRRRRESGISSTGISLPVLATSTTSLIARGIVTEAINSGRDDIMEVANDSVPQAPTIMAMRTSMLDSNVCEKCKELDFEEGSAPAIHEVGSDAYYEDMPPAKCLGNRRCRCAYIYDIPDDYSQTLEQIAAGQGFSLPGAA